MRYGIFADVHGNLEALQAVLSAVKKENVRAVYCGGDIVGYGADPCVCIKMIQEKKVLSVAGNHDWAVTQKINTVRFNENARAAVVWTRGRLKGTEKDFLANLPLVYRTNEFILVHGTLYKPECFSYLMDAGEAEQTFSLMDRPICFVGHSHVAKIFIRQGEKKAKVDVKGVVDVLPGHRYIVNVGSVGQPRDGNPQAAYCIFDDQAKTIEIKRIAYDVERAKEKILKSGLSAELGFRLLKGV